MFSVYSSVSSVPTSLNVRVPVADVIASGVAYLNSSMPFAALSSATKYISSWNSVISVGLVTVVSTNRVTSLPSLTNNLNGPTPSVPSFAAKKTWPLYSTKPKSSPFDNRLSLLVRGFTSNPLSANNTRGVPDDSTAVK